MLTSYLAMQNAIMASNIAQAQMMQSSANMHSALSFGDSQPLRPSFSSAAADEMNIKANETKVTVLKKLIDSIEKGLGKDIERSTPKYGGLDYKA